MGQWQTLEAADIGRHAYISQDYPEKQDHLWGRARVCGEGWMGWRSRCWGRLVYLLTLRNRGDQQVGFREELSSKSAWGNHNHNFFFSLRALITLDSSTTWWRVNCLTWSLLWFCTVNFLLKVLLNHSKTDVAPNNWSLHLPVKFSDSWMKRYLGSVSLCRLVEGMGRRLV